MDSFLEFLTTPLGLVIIGAVLIAIIIISTYNRFISLRNRVKEAFRAIDTYLEQRFDQLTKLADAVASYTDHEKSTHTRLAEIRSGYHAMSSDEKIKVAKEVENLESRLKLQIENYPELKADGVYLNLMRSITDIEEKLSASRRSYNANVYKYNTKLEHFPSNLFGTMMGFKKAEMFEATEEKRQDIDLRGRLGGM
ncbi:MAG TPA: LemA family protein [Bacillaceae bacterium]|nr:LemA family protein [Bacillaceae bacterium]